jgi:hypothetical protein
MRVNVIALNKESHLLVLEGLSGTEKWAVCITRFERQCYNICDGNRLGMSRVRMQCRVFCNCDALYISRVK